MASRSFYILGLNIGHDPSAAIVDSSGEMLAGAHESRFTRNKRERRFPCRSIAAVLLQAQVDPAEVKIVAYTNYEKDDLVRIRDKDMLGLARMDQNLQQLFAAHLQRQGLGDFVLTRLDHHLCHACTALYACSDHFGPLPDNARCRQRSNRHSMLMEKALSFEAQLA